MTRYFKRIKEKLGDKKGMTTLEIAISAFIIIVALAGFIDMVKVSQKLDTASSVTGYVGRVVANQGGVRTTAPNHQYGNYVTSEQLYREVKTILENGGVKEADFKLYVDGKRMREGTNIPLKDFGERIPVKLEVTYEWELISSAIGVDMMKNTKESSRTVVSSFKVRSATK